MNKIFIILEFILDTSEEKRQVKTDRMWSDADPANATKNCDRYIERFCIYLYILHVNGKDLHIFTHLCVV